MRRNITVLLIIGAAMAVTIFGIIAITSAVVASSMRTAILIGLTVGFGVAMVMLGTILAKIHARKLAMSRKWLEQATQP